MKFLKLFLLIPLFAFSFEMEFNKKFSHELPHDTLETYLTVTILDDTEIIVEERLEVFNQKIKSLDKVERKLDILRISPKYKHSNSTPKIVGYVGELKYKVNSSKARYMNEFISEITKLRRNRDTNVSINKPTWKVRESTYNVTFDLLRLEAINWAESYSINLSNDINKECKIKKIDINIASKILKVNEHVTYGNFSKDKTLSIPKINKEKIIINPKYLMECE